MNKINRVVLCIIDDLRAEHFFDFIRQGLLPNFKKLMDNGIYSENCITDFPSVTLPTQPTILTGTYTGDYRKEDCHGIPAYNWMGRDLIPPILRDYGANDLQVYKMNEDLGNNCQTLLEMVGDGNTSSITQFCNRGADYMFPESKIKLIFYYLMLLYGPNEKYKMTLANTKIGQLLLNNFRKPRKYFKNNEPPIASFIWFMTSDVIMHWYGYDSSIYKVNLLQIDKVMGTILDGLEEMGYLDDTAIAITADHGNFRAGKIGNLGSFYERNSLKPYNSKRKLKGNIDLAEFGSVGLFNFKGIERSSGKKKYEWAHPTIKELENYGPKNVNMFDELFRIEKTKLMYYRADDVDYRKGTLILKRKVEETGKIYSGTIEYEGNGKNQITKYTSENGEFDFFGYLKDEKASRLLDGKFHTRKEWIEATYHLDYPLYSDLVPRHFKNPRSSDIITSTCGDALFNIGHNKKKNENKFSHDIGLRNSMIVPLIIGGSPEIPHKEVPFCTTVDIVPTLLKMVGKKPHKSVVGDPLI